MGAASADDGVVETAVAEGVMEGMAPSDDEPFPRYSGGARDFQGDGEDGVPSDGDFRGDATAVIAKDGKGEDDIGAESGPCAWIAASKACGSAWVSRVKMRRRSRSRGTTLVS